MSLNRVIVSGKLIKDPESTFTPTGVAVCKFVVSVAEGGKDPSTGYPKNFLLNCTAWKEKAEYVQKSFVKGSFIEVDGRLQGNSWVDKDGKKQGNLTCTVEKVDRAGHYSEAVDVVTAPTESDDSDPFATNPLPSETSPFDGE